MLTLVKLIRAQFENHWYDCMSSVYNIQGIRTLLMNMPQYSADPWVASRLIPRVVSLVPLP